MDRLNGFVQVWHTSSCSADENNGIIEGHVTTSSDVTFTLDFPIPRESYVNIPHSPQHSSSRRRSRGFDGFHGYSETSANPTSSETSRAVIGFRSWTSTKIAEAIEQYSDVSTFHGMRFVCSKKFNRFRRITWILVVLMCLVALTMQVYKQVGYFYSNPKTVSVEKKHVGFVEFPSLTICNENSFKVTSAVEAGLFDVINQMMSGSANVTMLEKAGVANMKLDEFIKLLGNHKDTMLLRCKWGEEECGLDNFTTTLTDHGLCFTFHGPNSSRELRVQTPGASKGLQLTLNVEEYERMTGPHVASGIHILIHRKREYPLIEQFGQAVAAGSHTFMALSIKKEQRLSAPYDTCMSGTLTFVPNQTYDYDLSACQTDCFIKYVILRCGCKDYYMPGDVAICSLAASLTCLRPAEKDYTTSAEQDCKCSIPCDSEYTETTYSYAALSRSAIDKIEKDDMDKIQIRYRKALDVFEYRGRRNQYKKASYRAFRQTLDDVVQRFSEMTIMLQEVRKEIQTMLDYVVNMSRVRTDYIWAQDFVVQKNFAEAKNEMDETTLGELADDMYVFSYGVVKKVLELGTNRDKNARDLQFMLLKEQLLGRIWLTDLALDNLTTLLAAYETGTPILNYSLPSEVQLLISFKARDVVPRMLLKRALKQTTNNAQLGLTMDIHIKEVSRLLKLILAISQAIYESSNITREQEDDILKTTEQFRNTCVSYLNVRENFYNEIIEWPLAELKRTAEHAQDSKEKCQSNFNNILEQVDKLLETMTETSLPNFVENGNLLRAYLDTWEVTKFQVAEIFLNNASSLARSNLEISRQNIATFIEDIDGLWSLLDTCVAEMVQEILADDALRNIYETRPDLLLFGDFKTLQQRRNITEQMRLKFSDILSLPEISHDLQTVTNLLVDDLKTFNTSAVIDATFYSKNFIFLDVFFTDISYTYTEHQIAYDVFKLLSDIGGSMGLLVGASAISLFEFLDLFCVMATNVCKGSRRMGERFRRKSRGISVVKCHDQSIVPNDNFKRNPY